ncbi:MAG: anaerobic ribonucleoside-triphosphate reductase [Candidatus Gracilibacteria bacterium]|nr:anaerobic ribonucleoside-triphosphate reductase [Candidatus Gracilibacteria bacterium]
MNTISVNNHSFEIERTICEIYTRVMGYHRPVTSFNIGKKSEFYSRTYFLEPSKTEEVIDSNIEFAKKYFC